MNTKSLTVCVLHIFSCDISAHSSVPDSFLKVSNLNDSCGANNAINVSNSGDAITTKLDPNDWNSGPFQTTFDLPKNIAALADEAEIYFPANAVQPASDKVGNLANLAGGSEITDWYMQAFDLMPLPGSPKYAKSGWKGWSSDDAKAVPIIDFADSDSIRDAKITISGDIRGLRGIRYFLNFFNPKCSLCEEFFKKEFRKIAEIRSAAPCSTGSL